MKKIVSLLLCLLTAVSVFTYTGVSAASLKGDVNGDGVIDNKDVVALFRYVSGDTAGAVAENCDYNGDGQKNNKDVTLLFRAVSGLRYSPRSKWSRDGIRPSLPPTR